MSTVAAKQAQSVKITDLHPRILILRAPYYEKITEGLTAGARDILQKSGVPAEDITQIDVKGAFELPQALKIIADKPHNSGFSAFIILGCVIRGETSHYDFICQQTLRGLMDVSLHYKLALGLGVLTTENTAQAEARAGLGLNPLPNVGSGAAEAALQQLLLRHYFGKIS